MPAEGDVGGEEVVAHLLPQLRQRSVRLRHLRVGVLALADRLVLAHQVGQLPLHRLPALARRAVLSHQHLEVRLERVEALVVVVGDAVHHRRLDRRQALVRLEDTGLPVLILQGGQEHEHLISTQPAAPRPLFSRSPPAPPPPCLPACRHIPPPHLVVLELEQLGAQALQLLGHADLVDQRVRRRPTAPHLLLPLLGPPTTPSCSSAHC